MGITKKNGSLIQKAFLVVIPAILSVGLTACGGGGSDQTPLASNAKIIAPVPLRPCETTGPTAPACSASQVAGTH